MCWCMEEFDGLTWWEYFGVSNSLGLPLPNGWVQSYGSRYVHPHHHLCDVVRPQPMTVQEFQVA